MKFLLVIAAVIASFSAVAAVDKCDITKLLPLSDNADVKTCKEKSKYSPLSLQPPSADQLKVLCAEQSCKVLLSKLNELVPTDCEFNGVLIKSKLIDPITKACAAPAPSPAPGPAPGPGSAPGPTSPNQKPTPAPTKAQC